MSKRRTPTDTTPNGRRRVLRGATGEQSEQRALVELRPKSQREKSRGYQHKIPMLKIAAADPDLHRLAAKLDELTEPEHCVGGRPRMYPTWLLLVYGAAIHIFGSSLQAAGNLGDPDVLAMVYKAARPLLPPDATVPTRGPERHHWDYLLKARMAPNRANLIQTFTENAARTARECGLVDPATASYSRLDRGHVALIDGKVFTSPQGWRETKFNKNTSKPLAEPVARRIDSARSQHGEAGGRLPYGSKYAILAIRSILPGHRFICGVALIQDGDGRGEAGPFTELALRASSLLPALMGYVADGAFRGDHIDTIQQATGAKVINRPPRLSEGRGGIKVGDESYRPRVLPEIPSRARAFQNCDGHDLLAAGGRIFERVPTADGTNTYRPVERIRNKRDRLKDGTYRHYAQHELPCQDTGEIHQWWEPLTRTDHDLEVKFNRAEYLRLLPVDDEDFDRVYGWRNDIESMNSQLEHGFHKQRLPAWGEPNQTCIVLLALVGQNAFARHAWLREVDAQTAESPPGAA